LSNEHFAGEGVLIPNGSIVQKLFIKKEILGEFTIGTIERDRRGLYEVRSTH
jgi:hypothetical protein